MRILAYNAGHDGAGVLLENGKLSYAIESEKDDGLRYAPLSPAAFIRSLQFAEPPDVVAVSGFFHAEAGYFEEGPAGKTDSEARMLGRTVRRFSSSHVRSHLMCSYGLSPFPQGKPCYALIWEGYFGTFYRIDEHVSICKIGDVLFHPGSKYVLLYALADPSVPTNFNAWLNVNAAGKVMALAAYGQQIGATSEEKEIIEAILSLPIRPGTFARTPFKLQLKDSKFCDIGVETQAFKNLARHFSMTVFDRFYRYAKEALTERLPLLIAGGCGLNCEWNSQWKQCGLFENVFVPPCANDSGVALGAAIDASHHYTGQAKIEWSVYAGEPFIEDVASAEDFEYAPLDLADVSRRLLRGDVIAWVQGRYEMGPRALGNRSLLAAPFSPEIRDRLNRIKQREQYRPIAPICLQEEFQLHFEHHGPSPHMLYFQRVKSGALRAVTHVDGSARAQSVNDRQNPEICALLRAFREQSGVGVLCNTSLNFKGRGFINRLSQLFAFARKRELDGIVVGTKFWRPRYRCDRADHAISEAVRSAAPTKEAVYERLD